MGIKKDWYESSYTAANNTCVSARIHEDGTVDIRNKKNPDGPVVSFTREEWIAFVLGAKDGEFDLT